MKTIPLFLILFIAIHSPVFGQYQNNIEVTNKNYHDLNIEPMNDGSNDQIVASNLFDSTMQNSELSLKRVDAAGNIVWIKKYNAANLQNLRVFDIVIYLDLIFVTGSVDVNATKKVFIANIDALNGNFIGSAYYDIVSPNFNSTGLKIITTASDADGDSVSDPGLVVAGFFSDCYAINTTCSNNLGFLLRTDLNMNELWTIEIDTNISTNIQDHNYANGVMETSDGFFITGSATAPTVSNFNQQTALAHKVDFMGNFLWDMSYEFGNSNDVSVDSYYNVATNEIFMLNNYSVSHYFGITVFNNTTGAINASKSWYATGNDIDKYGFKIIESATDPNNLVITGYDRDENWVVSNTPVAGQSNLFVYEFAKLNGAPAGPNYQYLVQHTEPVGDDFNFWNGQMPFIYYPDISFLLRDDVAGVAPFYQHVGYRTMPSIGFTETELFKTLANKRNECENLILQINPLTIQTQLTPVISGFVPNTASVFTWLDLTIPYINEDCLNVLGTDENNIIRNIALYPNPTSDVINFSMDNDITSYIIFDVLGRTIERGNVSSNNSIDIYQLKQGMYMIKLYDINNNVYSSKFIKK